MKIISVIGLCSVLLVAGSFANEESAIEDPANDPAAIDTAMTDKDDVYDSNPDEIQIIDLKTVQKEDTSYFDFSKMLIPITHEARLGSPYGIRDHRLHRGVDVQVLMHEPVLAAYPGTVIMAKYNEGGYGHYVLVEHDNGIQTLYGHLSKRLVRIGDKVFPGDVVGLAGNTGRSSGAHLHFEIRYGNVNIDPVTVIDFPHWSLAKGAHHLDKKKVIQAHNKMQWKLRSQNVYVVKAGDTLESIAKWFNISVKALCRINKISREKGVQVGQRLRGCQ